MSREHLLAELVDAVRERLTNAGLSLNLIDFLDFEGGVPDIKSHKGVAVTVPATRNTERLRDQDLALLDDTVQVVLYFFIRPTEQVRSQAEALLLEEQIRTLLTDAVWGREYDVRFVGAQRGLTTTNRAQRLLRVAQTFTFRRLGRLGG